MAGNVSQPPQPRATKKTKPKPSTSAMPTTNFIFNIAKSTPRAAPTPSKKKSAPIFSDAHIEKALISPSEDRAEQERKKKIVLGGDDKGASAAKKEPGQYIAIDCEMVGVGPNGSESVLARVSLVNWHGYTLYDTFVAPAEKVTDYRTWVSGVRPRDLANAPSFSDVQKRVAELIKGRILVGHAIQNDLTALLLSHPFRLIRDTSAYQGLRDLARTKRPGLKTLARLVLGIEIQREGQEHSSVEDARATMAIFRAHKAAWDLSLNRKTADSARALAEAGSGDEDDEAGKKTRKTTTNGSKQKKGETTTKQLVPSKRSASSDTTQDGGDARKGPPSRTSGGGKNFDSDAPPKRRKVESKANWWTDPL
ncbi:hypothetical protein CF327_g5077 [Tilletia walkeri]|nr:hypothetical protein CF327_g5077 [Tilletia walkeri]